MFEKVMAIVVIAPIVAYLLFGLLYVVLPPPRDRKALTVLKLRPQVTSQVVDLVKSWFKR